MKTIIVFSAVLISCLAQRSPYAGRLPIGFPYIPPSTAPESDSALVNRFGEDTSGPEPTIKLPIEALGDVELVRRLLKLPIDQQPFWLINWKALESNRNSVQTYPQRENGFIDSSSNTSNSIFNKKK